ncbi:MAG: purine-nucleoside phosphorylase [Bacteroidetes bacterium]|nr:purine-nucleoside phosphorylase [Bacteroidota bacterium]
MYKKIVQTCDFLKERVHESPQVGIVLGTGLGGLVEEISIRHSIPYHEIPNFPVSTVEGHEGRLIFGTLSGKEVVAMQGRFHFYEGYTMQEITFPIRVLKMLGIELLILSNASGGVNPDFEVGDLMLLTDHINLMGTNPLMGPNDERLGTRFPDMSKPYDSGMIDHILDIARIHEIKLQHGVYAGVTGPTFETPAEYRYIRIIGADCVGMSTVPEVIVAHHMHLKCLAFSVISDLGVHGKIVEISHKDVIDAASKVAPKMTILIKELMLRI